MLTRCIINCERISQKGNPSNQLSLVLADNFRWKSPQLIIHEPLRIMARKTNSGTEFKPNRNLNCGRTKFLWNRKLTSNDGLKNGGFEKLT